MIDGDPITFVLLVVFPTPPKKANKTGEIERDRERKKIALFNYTLSIARGLSFSLVSRRLLLVFLLLSFFGFVCLFVLFCLFLSFSH